jgi:DNA-binding transcriptional MerR regulator
MENSLPDIPAKRYFTIGEVSDLCGVKPYVLRYWEQEFTQLKPMKRRGNRRYYQHHEVLLIRRIRGLLYEQGFTISGARNRLVEPATGLSLLGDTNSVDEGADIDVDDMNVEQPDVSAAAEVTAPTAAGTALSPAQVRLELMLIRGLLTL